MLITCSLPFNAHELLIGVKLSLMILPLNCVHLGKLYIALGFDQNVKAIFKNND